MVILALFGAHVVYHIQHYAEQRGRGRGQTYAGQAGVRLYAHNIGHGQAHDERLYKSLRHYPHGVVMAVEVADHAEQHCG